VNEVSFEGIPWMLRDIAEPAKNSLRQVCTRMLLEKKSLLAAQINFAADVVFVEEGWIYLTIAEVIVSVLQAGETFFSPVISNEPNIQCSITLTAATSAVVITVPKDRLIEALAYSPATLFDLYARASRRNVRMLARMAQQQTDSLEVRLASLLWSLAVPQPDGHRIIPAINQTILASCLGTGREEVSRKRQLLVQQGVLYRQNGNWIISADVGRALAIRGFGE
jgi:CRP-like cAMP-binding protein